MDNETPYTVRWVGKYMLSSVIILKRAKKQTYAPHGEQFIIKILETYSDKSKTRMEVKMLTFYTLHMNVTNFIEIMPVIMSSHGRAMLPFCQRDSE